jgi:C_GCAxxG_C_C family probable redox protein
MREQFHEHKTDQYMERSTKSSLRRRRLLASAAFFWPLRATIFGSEENARIPPLPLSAEDRVFLALSRFKDGFHCSQSVLAAYAEDMKIPLDTALRMGASLAGGSTAGGECGAVAAAYLVLGFRHGQTIPVFGDVGKERDLFDRIRSFVDEFRRRHGAITCRELLGIDVFTAEGFAEGRRKGLFSERCPRHIRDAIAILESLE